MESFCIDVTVEITLGLAKLTTRRLKNTPAHIAALIPDQSGFVISIAVPIMWCMINVLSVYLDLG